MKKLNFFSLSCNLRLLKNKISGFPFEISRLWIYLFQNFKSVVSEPGKKISFVYKNRCASMLLLLKTLNKVKLLLFILPIRATLFLFFIIH